MDAVNKPLIDLLCLRESEGKDAEVCVWEGLRSADGIPRRSVQRPVTSELISSAKTAAVRLVPMPLPRTRHHQSPCCVLLWVSSSTTGSVFLQEVCSLLINRVFLVSVHRRLITHGYFVQTGLSVERRHSRSRVTRSTPIIELFDVTSSELFSGASRSGRERLKRLSG